MKLKLIRKFLASDYTIGKLYINDEFFCDTLEDKVRDLNKDGDLNDAGEGKVFGETAIPYGIYSVIMTMSPRFKRILPRLVDVNGFDGILIHSGNKAKDTHGCILVGENKAKGMVLNSAKYEKQLVKVLSEAVALGMEITIEII